MTTPADLVPEIEELTNQSPSTFNPSSTQTFDFQGRPRDSDSDRD